MAALVQGRSGNKRVSMVAAKVAQAEALLAQGKPSEALALAQRLHAKGPDDPGLNSLVAGILLRMGRYEQAEFYARRADQAQPNRAALLTNLAMILGAQGRAPEAMNVLKRAVASEPRDVGARLALANALMDAHEAPQAAALLHETLHIASDPQVAVSYAGALLTMGEIGRVIEFTREAIQRHPDEPMLTAGLALALTYHYGADPDEIARAHFAYGTLMRRLRPPMQFEHKGTKDPSRRIRIAIVSPDLRRHSVAFFIEPFFEHHDRDKFEVYGYMRSRDGDEVTTRLKGHAAGWREIANLTDIQTAELIHKDGIDIAIDLAGHTLGNSLPAFALRPAPVQATYCGYPDTTGLSEIDHRIVDALTDPPLPEVDRRAAEHLVRLDPCFLCYRPLENAPAPMRNAAHPGPTFGSFNAARKINPGLIALWARLLASVPGSRLILKSFDFAASGAVDRIRAEFDRHSIHPDRLTFMAATKSLGEHLALYSQMDVALDAYPYHGTTTTCEALWMGVPVVTLAGNTHAGRVGVSLLTNAGVPELIARDEDGYVALAESLVSDAARLRAYRENLRGQLASSPICDAVGFAERFGAMLRGMWGGYCRG